MKLLMHTCCAPCSVYCIKALRKEKIEPVLYFYNPNIHPYMEYKARRDTLISYSDSINVRLIINDEYGLDEFCKNVSQDIENRCLKYCYLKRLEKTVRYAKENGFDTFTSTLFVSPYQKHEELKKICENLAKKYNIDFLYRDFRVGYKEGREEAKELGLYMQKYCGCIFSEEDRFIEKIEKDKKKSNEYTLKAERKVRLEEAYSGLNIKKYDKSNKEEKVFLYNLKKEVYKKYVEKYYEKWDEEDQKKRFEKDIKINHKNIKLICIDKKPVGFYQVEALEDRVNLGNICIIPKYQRKGIGTVILNEIIREYKDMPIYLRAFIDNPVVNLYKRLGFKEIDRTTSHINMILK